MAAVAAVAAVRSHQIFSPFGSYSSEFQNPKTNVCERVKKTKTLSIVSSRNSINPDLTKKILRKMRENNC